MSSTLARSVRPPVPWGRLALLWGALAFFLVAYNGATRLLLGFPLNPVLHVAQGLHWFAWTLATPVVVALARGFPLGRGRRLHHGGIHAAAAVAVSTALSLVHVAVHYPAEAAIGTGQEALPGGELLLRVVLGSLAVDFFVYAAIVAVTHALDGRRRAAELEGAAARLEAQLAQAQLQALRMQLNPHFLFNALQTVSALTGPDGHAARRVLRDLGDLLRISLEASTAQEIPLEEELAFLDRYLAIEAVRFQDRLTVDLDVGEEVLGAWVPNFLLQPLVENAIKHGVAPQEGAVRVAVAAHRRGERLLLRVEDDGTPPVAPPPASPGVGLRNTRARLARLYGAAATMEHGPRVGGGYAVEVALPLRSAPAPPPHT